MLNMRESMETIKGEITKPTTTVVDPGGSLLILGSSLICVGVSLAVLNRAHILSALFGTSAAINPDPLASTSKQHDDKIRQVHKSPSRVGLFFQYWWEIVLNTGDARQLFLDKVNSTAAGHGFHYQFISYEYLARLSAVTLFFAIASYLNALSAVIAGWRTPNIRVMDPMGKHELSTRILPDLGHDLLNIVEGYTGTWVTQVLDPDTFLLLCVNSTALFMLAHPKRLLILRRVFAIFGYCNILRAICVICTSLPDSAPRCVSQFGNPQTGSYKLKPMFPKAWWRAIQLLVNPSEVVSCGDMIFSGHTVALMLCSLVYSEYCNLEQCNTPLLRMLPPWFPKLLRTAMNVNVGLGLFAILGTRLHYTLDILIAVYVTKHAWSIYHRVAVDELRDGHVHRWAGGIQRLFRWLEAEEIQITDMNAYFRMTQLTSKPNTIGTETVVGANLATPNSPLCGPSSVVCKSKSNVATVS